MEMVHIKPQSVVVKQLESPQEPAIASACGCKQGLWAKLRDLDAAPCKNNTCLSLHRMS